VIGRPWELTDEERWASAESILARQPTTDAEQQMGRRRRSLWLLVGGLVVVTTIVVTLVLLLRHASHRAHQVPERQAVVGLVLQVLGACASLTGFVRLARSNGWRERSSLPTAVLTWRQRRALYQQLRGRRAVEPARLGLLRDLATRLAHRRGLWLIYLGAILTGASQTVVHPEPYRFAVDGGYLVLIVIAGATVVLRQRQSRRFLETYGEAG
jgi:hypothetical protein